ncbi:MAG: [FeFe] hydrogenase H-cluster radical SAM maturase HydE [Lachnospiraceae bacterium]|nr:[FeFe] hydrogenase H-cluster radical SAM maturase HydE [Lachnospiraceae bacterium]
MENKEGFIDSKELYSLIDLIGSGNELKMDEWVLLLSNISDDLSEYLFEKARTVKEKYYGNKVYIRGLIEFTNYCKNNCYYCGIRRDNIKADRYRLSDEAILECVDRGHDLGFRTFVLQGGEDLYYDDDHICRLVSSIKESWPDSAVTLSIGEKSYESYKAYYLAGADRYLLRHETAGKEHYKSLHPEEMSYDNRMRCLYDLKEIGYQVGAGFMVGSPDQRREDIARDLIFLKKFEPHMVGIGPFIAHKDTPFKEEKNGSLKETLFLLGIIRLMLPKVLLPSTTALATIAKKGRELGIMAGANVIMPNLSPVKVRKKYLLYDNKLSGGLEGAEGIEILKKSLEAIGSRISADRGDHCSLV